MELETLVRETVPDFIDVEIKAYIEEKADGSEVNTVKVLTEHNGEKYGFEVADVRCDGEEVTDETRVATLQRQYRVLIEEVIREELRSLEEKDE